jgi:hypothetical protein
VSVDRVINVCGTVDGMRIGKGNPSIRIKSVPVSFCASQTPHYLGSNPGRCGEKPTTNHLSYDTAV